MAQRALFVVTTCVVPSACWITSSQASYGAQVATIQAQMNGAGSGSAYESLGWLWTYPEDADDDTGLGKGITWAWDPALCDKLMPIFRERFTSISFIDCTWVQAAMHRAFSTWSQNHPAISFVDVTHICKEEGQMEVGTTGCSRAEVWVTAKNSSSATASADQAARAGPTEALFSNTFRYTNGQLTQQTVIEVRKGKVEFAYDGEMCWYLDSDFCSGFHALKKSSSPNAVYMGGVAILFTIWGIAMCYVVSSVVIHTREQVDMQFKALKDLNGDGTIDVAETAQQYAQRTYYRTQAFINALAEESILATAAKWTVVFIPWPFYVYIFKVCWDCYDFEAAAAHEIGHLLGFSHPDSDASSLVSGNAPGENSFHSLLAAGTPMDATSCLNPWADVVTGVPDGATVTQYNVRPSLMESFTTHNPEVCLQQDDYEALLTMYPTCEGTSAEPMCIKGAINIGYMRVSIFILGPFILSLLISIFIHFCVDHKEKEEALAQKLAARAAVARRRNVEGRPPSSSSKRSRVRQEPGQEVVVA